MDETTGYIDPSTGIGYSAGYDPSTQPESPVYSSQLASGEATALDTLADPTVTVNRPDNSGSLGYVALGVAKSDVWGNPNYPTWTNGNSYIDPQTGDEILFDTQADPTIWINARFGRTAAQIAHNDYSRTLKPTTINYYASANNELLVAPYLVNNPNLSSPSVAETMNTTPIQGDPSHVYVRTDASGDVWQLTDDTGNIVQWSVLPGHDSREVISGSVHSVVNASAVHTPGALGHVYIRTDNSGDVWQFTDPVGTLYQWSVLPGHDSREVIDGTLRVVTPESAAATPGVNPNVGTVTPSGNSTVTTSGTHIQGDASHVYDGTDSAGDHWHLTNGDGSRYDWVVKVNDDSRNVLPGTLKQTVAPIGGNFQTPAQTSTAGKPVAGTGAGGVNGGAVSPGTSIAVKSIGAPVPGTDASGKTTPAQLPADAGPASDPRHKYVGRDSRGDVWQIYDGQQVQEWAVKIGDPSAKVIPGTLHSVGLPGPGTVAQKDDASNVGNTTPTTTTTPATESKAALFIGAAALAIKVLAFSH